MKFDQVYHNENSEMAKLMSSHTGRGFRKVFACVFVTIFEAKSLGVFSPIFKFVPWDFSEKSCNLLIKRL